MSRSIVLGVCGGIAAYKSAALASALVQRGDRVRVVMTEGAQRFIAPLTFEALTRERVLTSLWDAPETIPHIALVRECSVLAIVPATANVIAKLALGIADDLLTNAALAARVPIVIAPAMNDAMWLHDATQTHVRTLIARGVSIVEPGTGFLAEREIGPGRLADQDAILVAIDAALDANDRAFANADSLAGERVLITAGPTREAIDPVRFLSNASTGTMGVELAREALARGAHVDLILGPTTIAVPDRAHVARVTSAQEMFDATLALASQATIAIAAAAVADWRPSETHAQKVKKSDGVQSLALERTPDILAALGERKNGTFLVGFAAETEHFEEYAREKLERKHLDAIAVNDVSREGTGFGTGENELVLLWGSDGRADLGRGSKRAIAARMWDALARVRGMTCS